MSFFDRLQQLVQTAVNSQAAVEAQKIVIDTLSSVKEQVTSVIDVAIEGLQERLDASQEQVKQEVEVKPVKQQPVTNGPQTTMQFQGKTISKRILNVLRSLPESQRGYYIDCFKEGKLIESENGRIDGPDFYVLPGETTVHMKTENREVRSHVICNDRCDEFYMSLEDVPKNIDPAHVFYCRVSIPKANKRDENFPVLYIIHRGENKRAVKDTYIDYIRNQGDKYETAMRNHKSNVLNRRHTDWGVNVQACRLDRKPRVA